MGNPVWRAADKSSSAGMRWNHRLHRGNPVWGFLGGRDSFLCGERGERTGILLGGAVDSGALRTRVDYARVESCACGIMRVVALVHVESCALRVQGLGFGPVQAWH